MLLLLGCEGQAVWRAESSGRQSLLLLPRASWRWLTTGAMQLLSQHRYKCC